MFQRVSIDAISDQHPDTACGLFQLHKKSYPVIFIRIHWFEPKAKPLALVA